MKCVRGKRKENFIVNLDCLFRYAIISVDELIPMKKV